jgi:alpha-N-arabinofuranosidase
MDGNRLALNVVNRHQDQAIEVTISLEDKHFIGSATVSEVNGPDIKAVNDFGAAPVRTQTRRIDANGNALTHTFPPHSHTMIVAALA